MKHKPPQVMPNYNHPYKVMVLVQATVDPTLAFQIPLPQDFYVPGPAWKLTLAGALIAPDSGLVVRSWQIGSTKLARLQGSARGTYPLTFRDEILIPMYADNLFDVQGTGVTAIGPVNYSNPQTDFVEPLPGAVEGSVCFADSPLVDRNVPTLDLYLFVAPIRDKLPVFLNVINLSRVST